jgi:hypothetical protein
MTSRHCKRIQPSRWTILIQSILVCIFTVHYKTDAALFVRWDPAEGGNGNYYAAIARPNTNASAARTQAGAMGGHLASIASEAENQFVAQLASSPELWVQLGGDSCCNYGPWLGGLYSRNAWRWSTSEPLTYTNWFPGQPANLPQVNAMHYYAEPAGALGATWNDIASSSLLGGYVVELEAAYVNANLNTSVRGIAATGQQAAGVAGGVQFAGFPFGSIHMNDVGEVTFEATLTGPGVTFSNRNGIWRTTDSQLQLLHRAEGYVDRIVVNDKGDLAYIDDAVPTANSGVYAQRGQAGVELIATVAELRTASGFPASWPEYNGLINMLGIDSAGRVAVMTRWDQEIGFGIRPIEAMLAEDHAGNLVQVARIDRQVPGMPAGVFFDFIHGTRMNSEGHLLVDADLRIGGGYAATVLVSRTPGVFEQVVQVGDPAADMPGYTYFSVGGGLFEGGWVVFYGQAVDSPRANYRRGIWIKQLDSDPRLFVAQGDLLPGLGEPAQYLYGSVQVNSSGEVALWARFQSLASGNESTGLWLQNDDGLELLVKNGDPAPGRPVGEVISRLDENYYTSSLLGDDGRLAIRASIQTANFTFLGALWAQSMSGELQLIAAEGQLVDVDPGPGADLRVIDQLISVDSFNGRGQLAFTASFTDGTRAILASDLVAIPEPTTLGLAWLFGMVGLRRRVPTRRKQATEI